MDSYKISRSNREILFSIFSFMSEEFTPTEEFIYNSSTNQYDSFQRLHQVENPSTIEDTKRKFRTIIYPGQKNIKIHKHNQVFELPASIRNITKRSTELIATIANQSNGQLIVTEFFVKSEQ